MLCKCPNTTCPSNDVRKLSMVYSSGTASSVTNDGRYAATSSTLLAGRAAPPWQAPTAGVIGVGLGFVVLGCLCGGVNPDNAWASAIVLGLAGACLLLVAPACVVYNLTIRKPLLIEWERKWMCMVCGEIFIPGNEKGTS